MLKTLIDAFALITTWEVIIAMFAASVYGLVIGSLPGLSATMATALLVPVTFYLSPIAAIATRSTSTPACCAWCPRQCGVSRLRVDTRHCRARGAGISWDGGGINKKHLLQHA